MLIGKDGACTKWIIEQSQVILHEIFKKNFKIRITFKVDKFAEGRANDDDDD